MNKRIFEVHTGHTSYGENWAKYTVQASGALGAIRKAAKLFGLSAEYAVEVKLITTLD